LLIAHLDVTRISIYEALKQRTTALHKRHKVIEINYFEIMFSKHRDMLLEYKERSFNGFWRKLLNV
jgi:hypothetical protein